MNNGLDTLFTRIWVQSITNVADDGVQLAKEMITDPSQVKDMVDISNSFNDLCSVRVTGRISSTTLMSAMIEATF